jgi:hypothetical protein
VQRGLFVVRYFMAKGCVVASGERGRLVLLDVANIPLPFVLRYRSMSGALREVYAVVVRYLTTNGGQACYPASI